jgi:hypothetical protein
VYLRGIANRSLQGIRRDESVTIARSTGSQIGAGLKPVATYADPVTTVAQLQALSGDDLKQLEGLNIQGTLLSCYVDGQIKAVERPGGTGGDLITMTASSRYAGTWLVVHVFENWGEWTRAAICLQSQ